MRGNGGELSLRLGDGQRVQKLQRAARRRYFRADDINGRLATRAPPGVLCPCAQCRGTLGNELVRQGGCIASARHRAVEMNLAKAGADILVDHDGGTLERGVRGLRLPAVGAEMIAAEEHPLA